MAELRSGMGQIPNAEPEGRVILGATCSIPRGSPELHQPTGPRTTHREGVPEPPGKFPGGGRALGVLSQGLRQPVRIPREVRHQPFQSAVFFFDLPQAAQGTHAEGGGRLFPVIDGGLADAEVPTAITDRGTRVRPAGSQRQFVFP